MSKDFYLDEILKEQFKGRVFDNQWFGVSLASTGSGGFSVIYFWSYCFRYKNDQLVHLRIHIAVKIMVSRNIQKPTDKTHKPRGKIF